MVSGAPQVAVYPQPPQLAVQAAQLGVPAPMMVHPVVGAVSPPHYYPHQLPRPVVASQPVIGGAVTSYQQPQPQQLPQPQMVPGSQPQMPVQAMPVQAQRQMPNPAQMPMPGHLPVPMQSRPLVPMPAPPTEAVAPPAGAEGKKRSKADYDGSSKPRRAQTALNFFSAFARKAVRKENPEISEDDLKSAVQQSWNMLAALERLKFEEKEAADLVRFQMQTKVFEELHPASAGAAGAGSAGEWSRVVISLKGTPEKLDSLEGPRTPAGKAKAKAKGSDGKGSNGSGSKGSGKPSAKGKSPASAKAKSAGKEGGKAAAKGGKDGEAKASQEGKEKEGKEGEKGEKGEKKRVRGPPANAHALKKPRTAYQVFCSEQKPAVMAQTKRAFAAKPPSDKPDGAAPVDKPSGAAGPSADGDAASSEAKKIALAVGVALSRAWKSLGTEGRGSYEERAEQEKILVIRDVQAAARRAGPGEGGLAKLREAIEAFAHKQPEQFVQLHERLVADEQSYLVRQQREQQRLRQKEEREAAEAYKQRYPIADELLRLEPPPPVPLAPRPSPRFGVNLPPELQRAAGLQLMIVEFVHTFSGWLRLAPFSMEELRGALLQRAPTVLLTELLLALLLPLLQEELAPLAEGGPPPEVDAEAAREALALSDGVRGPVPLLSRRLPMREASSLREASTAEALRWLLVRRGVTAAAEPEVAAALRALGAREAWELPMWEKLCLLCWLCDEVVGSEAMRKQLQANLEARVELQAAEAKAETERRAVARQEVQAAKEAAAAREAAAKEAEEEGGEEGGANPKPAKKAKAAKKAAAAGAGTNAGTGAGTSAAAVVAPTAPAAAAAGEEESGVTLPPDDEYDYGEAEADEDEDEEVEEEGKKVGRGRAMKRQREKATAARRDKLHMLKKRREKALERLHEATEKEDLPQLNEAMRLVQGAQLEGTRGGVKWRFPELSAALQLVEALQKREQALESIRARRDAVARLPLRTEPLGVDRDRTRCAA